MAEIISGGNSLFTIHEPEVCDVMLRFIKPGMCCLDCGANDGYFTGFMSHLVGETGLVLAFEPDTTVFDTLKKNTAELTNINLSRYALWSHDRPMQFFRASVSGYSSFIHYDDIGVEDYMIVARSLDTLLLAPHPNFIKIDCEGADEHVVRGAEKILRKGVECVTTEINYYINHKFGSNDRTLRDFMNGLGYDCFLLQEKHKPLFLKPDDSVTPTGKGLGIINAMFARRRRVEELWQYDCLDYVQQQYTIEAFISERSKSTPLMKERN